MTLFGGCRRLFDIKKRLWELVDFISCQTTSLRSRIFYFQFLILEELLNISHNLDMLIFNQCLVDSMCNAMVLKLMLWHLQPTYWTFNHKFELVWCYQFCVSTSLIRLKFVILFGILILFSLVIIPKQLTKLIIIRVVNLLHYNFNVLYFFRLDNFNLSLLLWWTGCLFGLIFTSVLASVIFSVFSVVLDAKLQVLVDCLQSLINLAERAWERSFEAVIV